MLIAKHKEYIKYLALLFSRQQRLYALLVNMMIVELVKIAILPVICVQVQGMMRAVMSVMRPLLLLM